MNAPLHPDRISILRNANAIRASWSDEERKLRANAARRYSRMLARLISQQEVCDEVWAVGAPSDTDLDRLAVA
jgi:hypothetical protein